MQKWKKFRFVCKNNFCGVVIYESSSFSRGMIQIDKWKGSVIYNETEDEYKLQYEDVHVGDIKRWSSM